MTFLPSAITPLALLILCLAIFGAAFFLVGTIGLLRLPDFFCRVHAATKCDTLGAGAVLLAMALFSGWGVDAAKIIALLLLVLIYSPTCGHALARASYRTGVNVQQYRTFGRSARLACRGHAAPDCLPESTALMNVYSPLIRKNDEMPWDDTPCGPHPAAKRQGPEQDCGKAKP